ncbi:MAG: glycoside hydrolase family 127 protein [Eubacteriales bacterium]|nr:glycoside hydrolase family 127 protein [Eubacteriales bacterium]
MEKQKYTFFSTNEIKPRGWLKKQLEIQADGLCGNLDLAWPDVGDSKWIGGSRDGWERVPYWLDGFIPMAYLLERKDLIRRAQRYVDAIIDAQEPDGWICPCPQDKRERYDVWAYMLICKVLAEYSDCSGDVRIITVLEKAFSCLYKHIRVHPIFDWAKFRWFECLIPIYWLYDRTHNTELISLARELKNQGFDYPEFFNHFTSTEPKNEWRFDTHVVNLAMCLKSESMYSLISDGDPDAFAKKALSVLMKYHSMAAYHFTGDECLAGDSPIRGSELCGVVEAMYSYRWLLANSGNPEWGDMLERAAFNALPAAVYKDMWSHQYDQMTNQPECSIMPEGKVVFGTNNGESNLFGLEPNYGCCTANFGQGFPKLALSAFMMSEKGFSATLLLPSELTFTRDGANVRCECITDYPFFGKIRYRITTDKPVVLDFAIRIPAFAEKASVNQENAETGAFYHINKEWNGTEEVCISLDFAAELTLRPSGMYCLSRGPLLYALPVKARRVMHEYEKNGVKRRFPYADYELFPESKWNYGFVSDKFTVIESEVGEVPFSNENPPVSISAEVSEIAWHFSDGVCAERPLSTKALSEPVTLNFIPYGCTDLRMTELPLLC